MKYQVVLTIRKKYVVDVYEPTASEARDAAWEVLEDADDQGQYWFYSDCDSYAECVGE